MGREVELVREILDREDNPGLGSEGPSSTSTTPTSHSLDII